MKKLGALILGAILTIGIGAGISVKPATDVAKAASYTATYVAGENASDATVNGINAMKVGTSKKGGSMSIKVGAGATSLTFYAAAWKGVTDLSITLNESTFELTADDGITGNPPFTLKGDAENFKFTTTLSNITAETTLNVTSSIAKRYVIWGAEYTSDIVPDAPTTTPEPELINVSTIAEAINHSAAEMTQKFAIKGVEVTGWKDSNTDGTKFGNFNITDGTQTILVYGATANKDNIKWDEINAIYKFPDSYDFLENELTKQITIGSELDLTFLVTSYKGTKQLKAIVTSVNNENVEDDPIEPEPDTPVEPEIPQGATATFEWANATKVSFSSTQAVYSNGGITVTNDKAASTNAIRDCQASGDNSLRLYKGSNLTISANKDFYKVEIAFDNSDVKYTIDAGDHGAIVNGNVGLFNIKATKSFTLENFGKQVRVVTITVYFTPTAAEVAATIKELAGGWENEVTTANCYANYEKVNEMILALSAEELETFKTSNDTEIASARTTYERWCFANGATPYSETVGAGTKLNVFGGNNYALVIISVIGIVTVLGATALLVIKKRKYSK